MLRTLSPIEHLVIQGLCVGQSNLNISQHTHLSIKCIENTISRSAKVFGVKSNDMTNSRVLLAIAYQANFQDGIFSSAKKAQDHLETL